MVHQQTVFALRHQYADAVIKDENGPLQKAVFNREKVVADLDKYRERVKFLHLYVKCVLLTYLVNELDDELPEVLAISRIAPHLTILPLVKRKEDSEQSNGKLALA